MDRLAIVAERKRSILSSQLGIFSEHLDDCVLAAEVRAFRFKGLFFFSILLYSILFSCWHLVSCGMVH